MEEGKEEEVERNLNDFCPYMVNITQFPFRKESTSKRMIYSWSFISPRPLLLQQHRRHRDGLGVVLCVPLRYVCWSKPAIKIFSHARVFKSRTASLPKSHPKANSQAVVNQALLTQQTKQDLRCRVFQSANAIFGAQFSRLLIGSQLASRKRVWMGSERRISGDDHDGMLLACLPRSSKALRAENLCKTTST